MRLAPQNHAARHMPHSAEPMPRSSPIPACTTPLEERVMGEFISGSHLVADRALWVLLHGVHSAHPAQQQLALEARDAWPALTQCCCTGAAQHLVNTGSPPQATSADEGRIQSAIPLNMRFKGLGSQGSPNSTATNHPNSTGRTS